MSQTMLTTIDNPFDPFTQFDNWFAFDEAKGYHSCSYLARIAKTSISLSDLDYELEVEDAIDWIVENDPLQIYKKVSEKVNKEEASEPKTKTRGEGSAD